VRGGSIIPQQPIVQDVDETPQGPLTLNVYPGPQCRGSLYTDDGNTMAYKRGESLRMDFACSATNDRIDVNISAPAGTYQPWFHELQLRIYGISGTVKNVSADKHPIGGWQLESGVITLAPFQWGRTAYKVSVELGPK
jgi:alpha-glucosidase